MRGDTDWQATDGPGFSPSLGRGIADLLSDTAGGEVWGLPSDSGLIGQTTTGAGLMGPMVVPPGAEQYFAPIERDPFRADWDLGGERVPLYNVEEMSEENQNLYREADNYLYELEKKWTEEGFSNPEDYFRNLERIDPWQARAERREFNRYGQIWEDLGADYRYLEQQSFQDLLASPQTAEWLESSEGQRYLSQAAGLAATSLGIDPASVDMGALLNAVQTGGLESLLTQPQTQPGATEQTVTQTTTTTPDQTITQTVGDDFYYHNSVSATGKTGYDFLPDGVGGLTGESPGGSGIYGVSFGDFAASDRPGESWFNDYINSDNAIMGYNPIYPEEGDIDFNLEPGEFITGIFDSSSNSASIGGLGESGSVSYPSFLVNAANNEEPGLMSVSGGDPFAWWDSLSDEVKNTFTTAYGDEVVSIADPTSDIYKRDESGNIVSHYMPAWLVEEQSLLSGEPNHKAWTHLSAEERERLQNEAGKNVNKDTTLIEVVKLNDKGEPVFATGIDDNGEAIFNTEEEEAGVIQTADPAEPLTIGQFIKLMFDTSSQAGGWDLFDSIGGVGSEGGGFSDISQVGAQSANNDQAVNLFNRFGGNEWDEERGGVHAAGQNSLVPTEIVEYIAENIDDYLELIGADQDYVLLGDSVGEDTIFGESDRWVTEQVWVPHSHGGGSYQPVKKLVPGSIVDDNGQYVLNMLMGSDVSGFLPKTFGDLEKTTEIDWMDFFSGNLGDHVDGKPGLGGARGWSHYKDNPLGDGFNLNENDPFGKIGDPTNFITHMTTSADGLVFPGIEELMARIAPLYEGYKNLLASSIPNAGTSAAIQNWDQEDLERKAKEEGGFFDVDENGNFLMSIDERGALVEEIRQDLQKQYDSLSAASGVVNPLFSAWENYTNPDGNDSQFNIQWGESIVSDDQNLYEGGPVMGRNPEGPVGIESVQPGPPATMGEVVEEQTTPGGDILLEVVRAISDPSYPNREAVIQAAIEMHGIEAVKQMIELLQLYPEPGSFMEVSPVREEGDIKYSFQGGGSVNGMGGGMDDTVPAITDGTEPAKLSSGEFVMPADVVSHLGDGNNENGAAKLHDMMNRIRTFKTGNTQQPSPVNDSWVMPA